MYRIPIDFHDRLTRNEIPIMYIVIETHLGDRAYAEKELAQVFDLAALLADGTYDADGSRLAGSDSLPVIDKAARVLSFGYFERTVQPLRDDLLISYQRKQIQHLSVELDNADRYFSELVPKEPFLSRALNAYVGFEADPQSEHLSIFKGIISELSLLPKMTVIADER